MLRFVYKVKFLKSSLQLNDEDYDKLSDHERIRIDEFDTDRFFDFDDTDGYTWYVITDAIEMKVLLGILSGNLIEVSCKNLSSDILSKKINLESDINAHINKLNSKKFKIFISELNKWIYQNLDMDTVLDRISESGIESLTETEQLFLNNFK